MPQTIQNLEELYSDTKTCAELVGLSYVSDEDIGLTRVKHGSGFSYQDIRDGARVDADIKRRITELVIPPAWQKVWICPSESGHVLATGIDEKGRKQYIYHPKWRTMRDLIKFYRMLVFAKGLPKIRRDIEKHLSDKELSRDKVMAAMLWILDNSYIRIGNDTYFESNASVGLTTLTDRNIVIAGSVVTLAFKGKSGKDQQITFDNKQVAAIIDELRRVRGARLFRYQEAGSKAWHDVDSSDINTYLHETTGLQISAKDFRTWGGTLMAFMHLIEESQTSDTKKTEKSVIEAIDQAAAVLGNTRTVARASYVHPHILASYNDDQFSDRYESAKNHRKITGLDSHESELFYFLEDLFEKEFELVKSR